MKDGERGAEGHSTEVTLWGGGGAQTQALQPLPATSQSAPRGPFAADTQEGLLCDWRNNCCSSSGGMKSQNRLILVPRLARDTSRRSRSQQDHRTSAARLRHWKIGLTETALSPTCTGNHDAPELGQDYTCTEKETPSSREPPSSPGRTAAAPQSSSGSPQAHRIQTTSPAAAHAHRKTTRGTSS